MKFNLAITISNGVVPDFSFIISAGLFSYILNVSRYLPASSELQDKIKLKSNDTETLISSLSDLP